MPESRVSISSGNVELEGVLHTPEGVGPFPAVVVCHPHPQYGGDMHNNVVMAVVRALTRGGMAALRFNFRGVGRSGGSHDNGNAERDDVHAALAHAATLPALDPARTGLAGYSFGAWMSADVASPDIPALALIALPLGRGPDRQAALAAYPNPLLLVAGDEDHVCPAAALRELAKAHPGPVEVCIVEGTDHFWAGYESDLEEILGGFFARHLAGAGA